MVLYRRQKKFDDEIRVIKIAITVFSKENILRFNKAYYNPLNINIRQKITDGFRDCYNVMGPNGWYTFVPYPVNKYKNRLKKAELLKVKSTT
jgi:hypothetical protein